MSTDFAGHAADYLRLRRSLGHDLAEAHRLLPRFVSYLDAIDATRITTDVALEWVRRRDVGPASSIWPRRMTMVRGFARYMSGIDPATEIPPSGLVTHRQQWKPPFIYSANDIQALLRAVPVVVPTTLRRATVETMIGLLACTGLRVSEAIALARDDVDCVDGMLIVRASKFTKNREVLLDPTATDALTAYAAIRDRHVPISTTGNYFCSGKGTPVIYSDFGFLFRRLVTVSGVGTDSAIHPRIHDLRHSFAVHTLVRWYRNGDDVAALLPRLSTYMGHRTPVYTYWYLSANPELLALAAERLQNPTTEGLLR
ncbi:tyrosine-type recombinase/integrase [Nocardia sp. NPDC059239]|uniref:tyrosine-type recombinase/integrase n=1 Tax=Nocardia sp. NPDC059239 TaxID=3346785 RepID=UPI003693FE52